MKKRWDYDVNIHVKSDVKSVKEGADTTERELTRTQRKLLEMEKWLKKNAKLIEAAFKAAEIAARFSGQAFTEFQRMMSGLSNEVGKVKTSFDALKTSIEAAANAKRKFGESVGTGGGGGSGGSRAKDKSFTTDFFVGSLAAQGVGSIIGEIDQLYESAKKTSLEVNQMVANISTIKDIDVGKTADQLYDLSTKVPQSAQQLGEGLYNIFSSVEATQSEAVKLLEQFAKGATAARTDTETFGTSVLGVINAYKLSLDDASHVSDVFFNTVKLGVVNGQELASNLGLVTQSAKNAGVTFDELGGLIAGVTKEGGPASQNINNLANFLQKLPTSDVAADLKKMNVEVTDADGKFRPVLTILGELKTKLDALSPAARAAKLQEIFPDVQARTGLLTLLSQLEFMKNATLENAAATGVADEAYRKMSGTAATQFQLFYNSLTALLAKTSEWVTENQALGSVLGGLGKLLGVMADHTGAVLTLIAALGALTIAYSAVFVAAGTSGFISALSGSIFVIQNVIRAMVGLQTAFITTGEVAVAATGGWLALVAILGTAAYAIYSYSQSQAKTTDEILQGVEASNASVDALNKQRTTLNDLGANVGDLSKNQQTLTDIYKNLNIESLERVNNATNEKGAVGALAEEIERLNRAKGLELEVKVIDLAERTATAYEKQRIAILRAEQANQQYQNAIGNLTPIMAVNAKTGEQTGAVFMTVKEQYDQLGRVQNQTAEEARKATDDFNQLKNALDVSAKSTGATAAQFIIARVATGQMTQQTEGFMKALDATAAVQGNLSVKMDSTTGTINEQADAIGNLRKQLKGLISESQARIDERVAAIALSAKDKAEAIAMAKRSLGKDDFLYQDFQTVKLRTETEKAASKVFSDFTNPTERGTSGGSRSAQKIQTEAARTLADRQLAEFNSAMRRLDDGMKRLIEEYADKYRISRQLAFAQIFSESGFNAKARSSFNSNVNDYAYGLTQQLPATASRVLNRKTTGKELQNNPRLALTAWGEYMTQLFDKFGDWNLAVLAYHQGEGTVQKLVNAMGKGKSGKGIIGPKGRAYGEKIATLSGVSGNQRFDLAQTDTSKNLDQIAEAQARINKLVNEGGDANERQLDALRDYENNLKEIEKLTDQINRSGLRDHVVFGLPDSPEDASKLVERLKAFTDLQKSISTQTESSDTRIFELTEQMNGGVTDLEKFDYQLQVLRSTGKLTAGDFALLADQIDDFRQKLKQVAELEAAQRLQTEARAAAAALDGLTNNFREQINDLKQAEDLKPFGEFIDQMRQIKDIDLPVESFAEFREAISPDGVDVEKLASIARFWLEVSAAIGGTDPAKIDDIIGRIKTAAAAFNQLTEEQKKAKNAADFKSLDTGLTDQLDQLLRGGKELSQYEQTLKALAVDYRGLSEAEKANLLDKAAQIDAVRAAQDAYDNLRDVIGDSVQAFAEGGWQALFDSIKDRFKRFLIDMATEWLASKFFKTFMSGGKGVGIQNGSSGNGLLDSIKNLFGIGGRGSSGGFPGTGGGGTYTTPPFVNNLTGGGSGGSRVKGILDYFDVDGNPLASGKSSSGLNSLFGKDGFGNNVGTYGTIGAGAALLGGFISSRFGGSAVGRRVGGLLSGAGSGLAIGASIGSIIPGIGTAIGAGVGALIGGLVGLFGAGGQRKKDEKARTQGMVDALGAIDKLIAQVNSTPDFSDAVGVINQGAAIKQNYLDSMGQLKDNKTRNIALKDVSRIDAKLRELETLAKTKASKTKSRVEALALDVPTFADGGAVSDFVNRSYQHNPSGYITGPGSARSDSILARISNGEYILPANVVKSIGRANLDALRASEGKLFKYMIEPQMKFADGGAVGMISGSSQSSGGGNNSATEQPPKVETHIYIQKTDDQTESVKSETYWTSSEGKRMLIDMVEQEIDRNGSDSKVYRAISRARKRYGD